MGGWLRSMHADLLPSPGSPLPPLRLPFARPVGWLPHIVVTLAAGVLAGAGWHVLLTDYAVPNRLAAALGIAQALPLVLALFGPLPAWWLSVAVAVTAALVARSHGALALWPDPTLLVFLATLAVVGLRVRPRVLVELWVLTVLAGTAVTVLSPGRIGSPDLLEIAALAGTVLIASGSLRALVETRHRLAEQTSISEAERQRRALLEERARIARELHDVVAHHMSVIAIQAEAAPYRVPAAPAELTRSFAAIRANALDALTELRRVLGVLRDDGEDDRAPQPTLDRIEDLAENGRAGGLAVSTRVTGGVRPLPRGVELSAYRIVQEALSNAMRHAPGSEVQVELRYEPDAVAVRVTNGAAPPDRPAPGPGDAGAGHGLREHAGAGHGPLGTEEHAGAGHGLLGMRERAAMLGAELVAGPDPGGGYAVTAVLPTTASPSR